MQINKDYIEFDNGTEGNDVIVQKLIDYTNYIHEHTDDNVHHQLIVAFKDMSIGLRQRRGYVTYLNNYPAVQMGRVATLFNQHRADYLRYKNLFESGALSIYLLPAQAVPAVSEMGIAANTEAYIPSLTSLATMLSNTSHPNLYYSLVAGSTNGLMGLQVYDSNTSRLTVIPLILDNPFEVTHIISKEQPSSSLDQAELKALVNAPNSNEWITPETIEQTKVSRYPIYLEAAQQHTPIGNEPTEFNHPVITTPAADNNKHQYALKQDTVLDIVENISSYVLGNRWYDFANIRVPKRHTIV